MNRGLRGTLSGHGVTFKTRLDGNIIEEVATTSALNADLGGLCPD